MGTTGTGGEVQPIPGDAEQHRTTDSGGGGAEDRTLDVGRDEGLHQQHSVPILPVPTQALDPDGIDHTKPVNSSLTVTVDLDREGMIIEL